MDLKQYFKKIKDAEASIDEPYPLVVSLETSDGGRPGAFIEVSRAEAAKAIVEGRAVLANAEQKISHFELEAARKKSAIKAELSRRLQIAIISDPDLREVGVIEAKEEQPKGSR